MSKPSNDAISMAKPDLQSEDEAAVLEVLRTGRLGWGPRADEFETMIAEYVGVKHAVAVSSGTAALHLIVRGLGIGPGDEVLLPSFTFAACANAVLYERAKPVFVDIDPETFNLHPADLDSKIGPHTRAVMAVDVFGQPADWDAILDLASRHDLRVIDDCCEALGAEYKGRKVGSFGDAAAFAFYPNKQITTGEGGMLVTDNTELATLARALRNQGREEGHAWLDHQLLGFNYRLDEMSAALGVSQLRRIEEFVQQRTTVATHYTARLKGFDWVRPPAVCSDVRMSWFLYVILLDERVDRSRVIDSLAARSIPTRVYFPPLHQQSYMQPYVDPTTHLPATENVASRALALPFHTQLTEEQVDRVVSALREAVEEQLSNARES